MRRNNLLSLFRRAFTLVELIIVIVILGLLAAISIVGYSAVVDRAEQAAAETTLQSVEREYRALAAFNIAADSTAGVPITDMTAIDGIDYSAGDTDDDGLLEPGETISFDGVELTLSTATTPGSISGDAGTGVKAPVAPSEVRNVTLVASGFEEFSLSFDAPADDGGSEVTGFEWRAAVDGGAFTDWEPTAGMSDTVSVPAGVADAVFEIRAVNAAGASDPVLVSAQIPQFFPNAPPQVSITPTAPGMFDVSWDAATVPNGGPAASYEWRISLDGGTWSDWEAHSSLTATLSTDVASSTVDFEVRAVNAAGVSAATAVSETIPTFNLQVEMFLWGAGGAAGANGGHGGGGGSATGTAAFDPDESYAVVVGGRGLWRSPGAGSGPRPAGGGGIAGPQGYGGQGGGYTGVFLTSASQANAILIAGGGGGGAWEGAKGGAGGGATGGNGGGGYTAGGRGGTQTSGGASYGGSAGTALRGGDPGLSGDDGGGGGGGGGYWGGGAGTGNNPGAAGGGGSGYGSPTLTESFQLVSGSGRNPGNSGHWLRSGAGTGGRAGVSAHGKGGLLVIRYEGTEVLASGGTISTDGTYTYHTFTAAGTFSVG